VDAAVKLAISCQYVFRGAVRRMEKPGKGPLTRIGSCLNEDRIVFLTAIFTRQIVENSGLANLSVTFLAEIRINLGHGFRAVF
jgi:hypothetical protein